MRPAGAPAWAHAGLALATLAMASASLWVRLAAAPPLAVAFWRLALTLAVLAPPMACQRRPWAGLGRREASLAAAAGALLALHFAAWIAAVGLTTVASATVLGSLHPLAVLALGALLLGERPPARALPPAGAALVGAVLVGSGDWGSGPRALAGDLLALVAAASLAGYLLMGRALRPRLGLLPYTVVVYGVAAACLLVAALATATPLWGYGPRTWATFAALAAFPTLLGHTVYNWALRHVRAATAAFAALGEPALATVLAWLVLGELPGAVSLAGAALTLAGIVAFARANAAAPAAQAGPVAAPGGRRGTAGGNAGR